MIGAGRDIAVEYPVVTMKPRTRKALAILCVGLIVFAAFLPAAAPHLLAIVIIPLWLVVPAVVVTILRRRAARSDHQPVSLLCLVLFRAPPLHISLA
jgi:hypothetical protein